MHYTWEEWRAISSVQAASDLPAVPFPAPQEGAPRPLRAIWQDGRLRPLRSVAQWEERRTQLLRNAAVLFGTAPDATGPVPVEPERSEEVEPGLLRQRMTFWPEPDEPVRAFVLRPAVVERRPAVLCLHQTVACGAEEPAGLAGDPDLHYALHLARRGFVTLSYDALCFGDRRSPGAGFYGDAIPFYRRHPTWSLFGKMAFDAARAVDALQVMPEVDASRIGCMGHSLGGHSALISAAFDQRIRAVVSNCGFVPWMAEVAIGRLFAYYRANALLPRLAFFDGPGSRELPVDYHELLALVAPRPFLVIAPPDDSNWQNGRDGDMAITHDILLQAMREAEELYRFLGAEAHARVMAPPCGHAFPAASREAAFAFLVGHLGPVGDR